MISGRSLARSASAKIWILYSPPASRMGDHDAGGGSTLALGDPVDDPAHYHGGDLGRRVRHATDHHRNLVTDAPLELAAHPIRVGVCAARGGLPHDHLAVGREIEH
jgi:hypothetical protein